MGVPSLNDLAVDGTLNTTNNNHAEMESRGPEDSKNVKTSKAYFFEGFISFFEDFSLTIAMKRGNQATSTTASKHKFKDSEYDKGLIQITPGIKKILKCSYVLQTSTPKLLLVLLQNNTGHSRKYNFALYLFTCTPDIT